MKRMIRTWVIAWLAIPAITSLAVNAAWADSSVHKNYAKVNLGVNEFTGGLDDAGYNAGVDVGAAYGRYLGKYMVLEGGINSFQTNQDISGSSSVAGTYEREDSIFVNSILATLKGEFPVGPVTLYGGAGVGGYFVNLFTDIETSRQGDFDKDDDDIVFGVHLVAGGHYDITPRFFVGVEGMYRWTEDIDIQQTAVDVPIQVEGDLNGYAVTLLAGFRF
jgi:opacity protein-like surface antigen